MTEDGSYLLRRSHDVVEEKTGTSSPGHCAALVSLDDAWRTAFNHRVVNTGAEYKWHCD